MAAPTPAPPAVFSRAQDIVPIIDEDIDIIASVPEVRIFKCNDLASCASKDWKFVFFCEFSCF